MARIFAGDSSSIFRISQRTDPLRRRVWTKSFSNDPSSHPPDKLKVLETADEWCVVFGYPGPSGPAPDEVADNFIIPDMMAKAATGKLSPEDSVKWAKNEIDLIYKKWANHA